MPKPTEYTPARRVAMQVTLWGILAASLGVAAIVDGSLTANVVKLTAEHRVAPLHFQLPAGWEVVDQSDDDVRIVAVAEEPKEPRRTLRIYKQAMRRNMPPLIYMDELGLMTDIFGRQPPRIATAKMGGAPAIFMRGQTIIREGDEIAPETELVICAVYPRKVADQDGSIAVTIWLSNHNPPTPADQQLLKLIANSVKVD